MPLCEPTEARYEIDEAVARVEGRDGVATFVAMATTVRVVPKSIPAHAEAGPILLLLAEKASYTLRARKPDGNQVPGR